MPVLSAGILLHRASPGGVEVFIAHMGGPFWARRVEGAWSIPKGECDPATEEPLAAARREFVEELGVDPPRGDVADLGEFAYASGKRIRVFALDGAGWEPGPLSFGTFALEWPPRSGRMQEFPEVDEARWVAVGAARTLLVKGQRPVLEALSRR
ncbi:NUDIX domain-containing protein [Microbacterium sp. MEC084]|uniref:NUDIX domain-containing protein n=1 Tax=Microbacterium sp. MEC084 TaxID=1963027 RepID=UPI00106F8861|nr:NUDIX domain-containing protein [Microbacterium sp. MEC084]MCD1269040.1 NUDIX domain-containing protein [Microbacterium sp. MEC084]